MTARYGLPKLLGLWLCAASLVCWTAGPVAAEDRQLDELIKRLDRLEKQNEELRQQLQSVKPPAAPAAKDDKADKDDKKEKEKLTKAVEDVLKEKEKKDKEKKEAEAKQKELEGYEVGKLLDMKGRWNNGLWFETEDKAFRFHVEGRAQIDAVWVHAPKAMMVPLAQQGIGEYDDAINFRRARLGAEGTFWEVFDFYTQYDFVNTVRIVTNNNKVDTTQGQIAGTEGTSADRNSVINTPVPTDFWIQWREIPVIGTVRVGNQKQFISIEHLTSSRFLDFLERSLAFDAFLENGNNGFVPGISVYRNLMENNLFVGGGVYKPNFRDIFGWDVGDGEMQVVGRIAGTPYYRENGRYLLHLGLGVLHSTADDGVIRFRSRPLIRNGPAVLHNIVAQIQGNMSNYNLVVPEFAAIWGPLSVVAEWYGVTTFQGKGDRFSRVGTQSNVPPGDRGTLNYSGGYVEVGYFLTGESRGYNRTFLSLDRQPVNENTFFVKNEEGGHCFGRGAWQVLARYDYVNLDSKGVNGGVINNLTLGVNWYLNPNSKIQLNYGLAYRDATEYTKTGQVAANGEGSRDGLIQSFGTRFAFDF